MTPVPPKPQEPADPAEKPKVIDLYRQWQEDPRPETMSPLVESMTPLLESQIRQYRGTLPENALRAHAKKFAVDAVRSYDPKKGAKLTTHVVNALRQLHRKNYEAQRAVRMSEELQRSVGKYMSFKQNLESELGREPTVQELSDELGWSKSRINRLERQSRGEVTFDDLLYEPTDLEQAPPDPRIDYVYHDLNPTDKLIMEWTTGYGGKQTLPKKEIAKKLGISPAAVSQRSLRIAEKLKEALKL